jgi:hypothetical protein
VVFRGRDAGSFFSQNNVLDFLHGPGQDEEDDGDPPPPLEPLESSPETVMHAEEDMMPELEEVEDSSSDEEESSNGEGSNSIETNVEDGDGDKGDEEGSPFLTDGRGRVIGERSLLSRVFGGLF